MHKSMSLKYEPSSEQVGVRGIAAGQLWAGCPGLARRGPVPGALLHPYGEKGIEEERRGGW